MTLLLGVFLASGFALEFGGGAAMAEERYGSMQAAPALSIQLFRDDSFWTAGVHALLPVGSPGGARGAALAPPNGGLNAWGVFAEGGLHTSGATSLELRVGAGIGRMVLVQCDCSENEPLAGDIGPALTASVRALGRVSHGIRLGLELGTVLFTNLSHASGSPGLPGYSSPPAESGLVHPAFHLLAALSWALGTR